MKQTLRCAIYTRKSTEEGLDQAFNSLDAQREACEAYVTSQKHEGWKTLPDRYDDGGFSGGNMERPGLGRLLADIKSGKVNVVVVYKVDRLTRALSDFAKIVEQFDAHGVSFVSVTQQFNTTSSMGRLTLNVLLSFAQFEREVAGERIRDKIAASKKKGMWMGGTLPFGYAVKDRNLRIVPTEAKTVRYIFNRYLDLGSIRDLQADLMAKNIRSRKTTGTNGRGRGGVHFGRGALTQLLKNPVYIGKIRHHNNVYAGKHKPILSNELWNRVQCRIQENGVAGYERRRARPSLLTGLLFDGKGVPLTPTHSNKKGVRYRYYIDAAAARAPERIGQVIRIPAGEIEELIVTKIAYHLKVHDFWSDHPVLTLLRSENLVTQQQGLALLIEKISVCPKAITIRFKADLDEPVKPLNISYQFGARSKQIISSDYIRPEEVARPDALKKAVVRGFIWRKQLLQTPDMTLRKLMQQEKIKGPYLMELINLTFLAPRYIESILKSGRVPNLSLHELARNVSHSWVTQREEFQF